MNPMSWWSKLRENKVNEIKRLHTHKSNATIKQRLTKLELGKFSNYLNMVELNTNSLIRACIPKNWFLNLFLHTNTLLNEFYTLLSYDGNFICDNCNGINLIVAIKKL